jgi:uncharacterized protein
VRTSLAVQTSNPHGPISPADRSLAPDVLRGCALLGILTMNVLAFGLHEAAYMNPWYKGAWSSTTSGSLDAAAYWVQSLLCDQRFMSIFAMLFGAAIVITTSRADEARTRANASAGLSAATIHYRRSGLLIALGLLHAYGLWYGDILFAYGLCALWLFPARKLRPGALIAIASVLFVVPIVIFLALGGAMTWWYSAEIAPIAKLVSEGATLTPSQAQSWASWQEANAQWQPTSADLVASVTAARGSLSEVWARNAVLSLFMQGFMLPLWGVWRVTSLMMLGMALWKMGVLRGSASAGTYRWMVGVGYGAGLPLATFAILDGISHDFAMARVYLVDANVQYVASLLVALGHIGLIMLLVRHVAPQGWAPNASGSDASRALLSTQPGPIRLAERALRALACVGRLSLSNYLLQTVLMVALFTGFGLFERMSRWQLLAMLPVVWALQVGLSAWWLSRREQGPLEGLVRAFVYRK